MLLPVCYCGYCHRCYLLVTDVVTWVLPMSLFVLQLSGMGLYVTVNIVLGVTVLLRKLLVLCVTTGTVTGVWLL